MHRPIYCGGSSRMDTRCSEQHVRGRWQHCQSRLVCRAGISTSRPCRDGPSSSYWSVQARPHQHPPLAQGVRISGVRPLEEARRHPPFRPVCWPGGRQGGGVPSRNAQRRRAGLPFCVFPPSEWREKQRRLRSRRPSARGRRRSVWRIAAPIEQLQSRCVHPVR